MIKTMLAKLDCTHTVKTKHIKILQPEILVKSIIYLLINSYKCYGGTSRSVTKLQVTKCTVDEIKPNITEHDPINTDAMQ